MTKEEEEFERQFKDWEKQFETWKQQNQNHPDKEAFAQYEKQWQEWRSQLLQRKEQLQKAKAEQLANAGSQGGQTNSTTISDSTSTSSAAMYYQHPQYMYMQPYVYPGATTSAAVPSAVVPQTVVPPAVVPSSMVTPAGVPPVSVPPAVLSSGVQQMPYSVPHGADSYGNQAHMGMSGSTHDSMNYDSMRVQDYENDRDMYGYGLGPMRGRNGPRDDGMGPNYEGFDGSNMPEEGDYQRDNWKYGRGRGRGGRGRSRGRGRDRWSESADMDVRPGGVRNQRKTLLPGGPGTFPEEDGPPPYEYPTEDCRDEFSKDDRPFPDDRPNRGHDERFMYDGSQYPHNDSFQSQPFDEHYPPDPNQYPPDPEFPDRFPPDRKRFPPDHDRFPDKERFPDQERFPPGREGFLPGKERFSRGQDRYPDDMYPPDDDRFPPDQEMFPPDQERFPPPKGGRFPPDDSRYDDRFPLNEEGFPERFPPRHMMDEGGFGAGEFDEFPPEDEMYGPPPYRDDYPPFDERGRGRGRYAGRGRRYRGDFDRFGPPFPPRMRNEFGHPDFQPDDRFGYPGDGPPRMPPPRGMRPPFEPPPPYGPRGRYPDEPFYGDGPGRYKSIDYTHRPASAVMGDDFNPNYEFESEFQDDVNAYRARPAKRKKRDSVKKSTVEKKKDKKDKDKDKDKEKDKDKDKDEEKHNIKDEEKDKDD